MEKPESGASPAPAVHGQLLVFILKSVSGRPGSLSSPAARRRVRELHANVQPLSTGEPAEEQRLLLEALTAFASSSLLHLQARPSVQPRWQAEACVCGLLGACACTCGLRGRRFIGASCDAGAT